MIDIILFCCALILLGFALFCLPAGIALFKVTCVRKAYNKKSLVDGGAHVKDLRIMEPLLAAKERWGKRSLERLFISAEPSALSKLFHKKKQSKIQLAGDLWLQEDFAKTKKIVILVHGFSDSAAGMAYLAEDYYARGISVLAVNLRAHGDSDGRVTGLGYEKTDGADLFRWVEHVFQCFGNDTKIILHGVSMGAVTVIQCAFGLHAPVVLVVADCGFSDFSVQLQRRLKFLFSRNFLHILISETIGAFASLTNFLINGFFFFQNSPKKILLQAMQNKELTKEEKNYSVPLLIFHGKADTMTLPSNAEELFEAASEPKKLVFIENAPHIGSWFYEKEKYMKMVFEYLPD